MAKSTGKKQCQITELTFFFFLINLKYRVQGKTLKTVATETLNLMSNLKIKGW